MSLFLRTAIKLSISTLWQHGLKFIMSVLTLFLGTYLKRINMTCFLPTNILYVPSSIFRFSPFISTFLFTTISNSYLIKLFMKYWYSKTFFFILIIFCIKKIPLLMEIKLYFISFFFAMYKSYFFSIFFACIGELRICVYYIILLLFNF